MESHTLMLFEIHEYMNSLKVLPTWDPYIRISFMLREIGHEVKVKEEISSMKNISKIKHMFYPFISTFYSKEDCEALQKRDKTK